jgi:polyisoprenyl-phosphate glycosyltransferase
LIHRGVRDALIQDNNSFPFFRASIARVGFRQKGIPYKRHPRVSGETHYNFIGMVAFGLAGILSSSTLLLRLTAYALVPWALLLCGLFAAGFATADNRFFWGAVGAGFLYTGLALAGLSVYVARTYKNTLFRPNYVVDRVASVVRPFISLGGKA